MTKIMKRTTLTPAEENFTNFFCGSVATGVATLVSFPFDVVRTRFVAQGEPKVRVCIRRTNASSDKLVLIMN